jgi:hypothetical protein
MNQFPLQGIVRMHWSSIDRSMIEDKLCEEFIISIIVAEKVTRRLPSHIKKRLAIDTAKKDRSHIDRPNACM